MNKKPGAPIIGLVALGICTAPILLAALATVFIFAVLTLVWLLIAWIFRVRLIYK